MWDVIVAYLMVPGQQLLNLLVSILFSVALSAFIAVIYKTTHRGMSYEPSLIVTILAIAPIVAMVMFFIQGNLVLSLGLVGSLSIIRFRTPIKDSRDMVFLFWSIGVGLGCGTYNWTITIAASLAISLVVMVAFLLRYRMPLQGEFILVVSGQGDNLASEIENVIRSYQVHVRIRSHQAEDDRWETVYELEAPKADLAKGLVEDLNRLDGVRKVSLLAPQLALPV